MKGRSPHNRPGVRKNDIYGLLLDMGGEARWKDLKDKARATLHCGPTTLKQTLDQLIEDKSVVREARLKKKGAEVWYRTITQLDLLKPTIVWKPTVQFKPHEDILDKSYNHIREEARKLEGKKKEDFLRDQLYRFVLITVRSHIGQLLVALRTAEVHKLNNSEALQAFDLNFDYSVRRLDGLLLGLLLEYREYSMEVIDQILREPFKPASLPPRSMKEFLGSTASTLKWIESYGKET